MYEANKALIGYKEFGDIPVSKLNRAMVGELNLMKPNNIVQFEALDLVDFFLNYGHPETRVLIFTLDPKKYNHFKHLRGSRFDIIRNDIGALNSVMYHYGIHEIDLIISRYDFTKLSKEENEKSFGNYYQWLSNHGKMIQVDNISWGCRRLFKCTFDKVQSLLFWEMMLPQMSLIGMKSKR